jgi:nicotinamide-nucleotide amidase
MAILQLQNLFIANGITLATAESCTGGNIAHQITLIPGSSEYFMGSVVSYANSVKESILGVSSFDIEKHGAVSETVAIQMADGVRARLKSDYAVSTTGIAGPTGGSVDKPVGTVWIGVGSVHGCFAKKFVFTGSRAEIIDQSSHRAFELVLDYLQYLETKG